ncbi:hypothetical protein B7494_g3793 [Chlorociboria aeruginascens]|nr:hypothetical protein B7494_g3793 [Chlorociboria aeruginascens]
MYLQWCYWAMTTQCASEAEAEVGSLRVESTAADDGFLDSSTLPALPSNVDGWHNIDDFETVQCFRHSEQTLDARSSGPS